MKRIEMCLMLLVALVAAACSSAGDGPAAGEPTAVATPEIPVAGSTPVPPTASAEAPAVSDQARIDAAIASLDAAPGQPLIAYDLLDATVEADMVDLTICGWTGDSVFDDVYTARYRTAVADDGSVTATELTTFVTTGDCLNTELIDTAIATINAYENYWNDVTSDPASFADDPRGEELMTAAYYAIATETAAKWVEDEVYFEGSSQNGLVPSSAVAPVLWRRTVIDGEPSLEIVICRDMDPAYGLYRDGALLDDGSEPDSPRLHSVFSYQLRRQTDSPASWQVEDQDGLGWADCFQDGTWVDGVNAWRGAPPSFAEIP